MVFIHFGVQGLSKARNSFRDTVDRLFFILLIVTFNSLLNVSICSRNSSPPGLEIEPEAKCLGLAYGLFGLFDHNKLILIQDREIVGELPGPNGRSDEVYKITKVVVIDLGSDDETSNLGLDPCSCHGQHYSQSSQQQPSTPNRGQQVQQTWNQIKNVTKSGHDMDTSRVTDPRERLERKLIEEIMKMINLTDSFYFSLTGDLTNTIYRRTESANGSKEQQHDGQFMSSRRIEEIDDRFFWNKVMISNLLECPEDMKESANHWIIPIVQGYFETSTCELILDSGQEVETKLILISRRSRKRAGTRYKRRGVDEGGNCANYVETEQVLVYDNHILCYVQIRGSIPLFWSQSGHSYRPPPVLERSSEESFAAFEKHFNQELELFGNISIVNLIDSAGRESILGDAYIENVIKFNSDKLTYISFDFHDYW